MNGHTIDRCYKLHGYPPKNKPPHFKKVATVASDVAYLDQGHVESTGLTMDQFNHLCTLLGKPDQSPDPAPTNSANVTPSANVAGIFCFSSFLSKHTWIIDSGASDHKCHSLPLLLLQPMTRHYYYSYHYHS